MLIDEEQEWLSLLHREDEKAIELMSSAYYEELYSIAFNFLEQEELASETTNKVFFDFWKDRKKLNLHTSLKKYFRQKIVEACVTTLRYKYKLVFSERIPTITDLPEINEINFDFEEDARKLIGKIIAALPEKNKLVLRLSRHESFKIHEIATFLKTSNEVVEFYLLQSLDLVRKGLVRFG